MIDPAGSTANGTATLAVIANTSDPLTTQAMLTVAANSAATPINIAASTDPNYSATSLSVTVLGLPADGSVFLSDGMMPVKTGESLTVNQLTGLEFAPKPGMPPRVRSSATR